MTEIDRNNTNPPVTTTRGLVKKALGGMVAVRFEATFLGGMSHENVKDGSNGALIVTSALNDPTAAPEALIKGGHVSVVLRGSFMDYIPEGSPPKNLIQKLSDRSTLHIGETRSEELLDEASKSATIAVSQSTQEPARRVVLTVMSKDETPEDSVKAWFVSRNELKAAA